MSESDTKLPNPPDDTDPETDVVLPDDDVSDIELPPLDQPDAPLGSDYLEEDAALGEVDAEGLLIQTPQALPPLATPEPPSAPVSLDELDFGAIFSAVPEKYQGEPPVVEAPPAEPEIAAREEAADERPAISEDQLDALVSGASAPAGEGSGGLGAVDPVELERLMAMATESPEAHAEPTREADDALESLVESVADEESLAGNADLDAPVVEHIEAESAPVTTEESVDLAPAPALVAPATPEPVVVPEAAPAADISQAMIDALIAAAGSTPETLSTEDVGNENLAAAATAASQSAAGSAPRSTTPPSVSPEADDLGHLIEEANRRARAQQAEAAMQAPEVVPARERKMPRLESPLFKFFGEHGARAVASLAAGILVAGATFSFLYARQTRTPDLAVLVMQRGSAVEEAMDAARKMIDEGEYERAATTLEGPIAEAPAGREKSDATFLRLEALYKAVPRNAPLSRYDAVQTEIDNVLTALSEHPRVADALHWKALLHERGELPFAALDAYVQLIDRFPSTPHMDEILVEAARLALELGAPDKAARYADKAVQEFPASPLFAEAKLLQGDAYARTGNPDAARQLYTDSLERSDAPEIRTEAVLRLGRLAFDEKNYDAAITQIRDYLAKTTTPEGNDAAYLLLAQALRKTGRDGEARGVLNDLLRFFPESKKAPQAYVELSQTLEELGERKAALQIAREGETRYPTDPAILKNLGELLGLDGNPFSAATTLLAADAAGAADPRVLLTAARHLRTAGVLDEAERTYRLLLSNYGGSPESFLGGVELAQLYAERGDTPRALERLENIALATEGTPQQLPALLAMAEIYEGMGLTARVAQASQKAAGLTDDPQVLARAAAALIKADGLTEGQSIVDRIDLAQVPPKEAYQLLSELGKARLGVDPPRGIETMEEAYSNYPAERMAVNDLALVNAYLAADRASAARRVVMDMVAAAQAKPEDAPHLADAATAWGDYLYERDDFRAASDAYLIADNAGASAKSPTGDGTNAGYAWARYQRANALLKLNELDAALTIFEEIAQGTVPWAREAASKAEIVRLQMRLRGVTPSSAVAQTPATDGKTPAPKEG